MLSKIRKNDNHETKRLHPNLSKRVLQKVTANEKKEEETFNLSSFDVRYQI